MISIYQLSVQSVLVNIYVYLNSEEANPIIEQAKRRGIKLNEFCKEILLNRPAIQTNLDDAIKQARLENIKADTELKKTRTNEITEPSIKPKVAVNSKGSTYQTYCPKCSCELSFCSEAERKDHIWRCDGR